MRYWIISEGDDVTGYEANTILEAIEIIKNVLWWCGWFEIWDTERNISVMEVHKVTCIEGRKRLLGLTECEA